MTLKALHACMHGDDTKNTEPFKLLSTPELNPRFCTESSFNDAQITASKLMAPNALNAS
jgi:hypothetical protein